MTSDELEKTVNKLKQDLESLSGDFYRNNFSSHQDFNKASFFNYRLKVPTYGVLPTTCEEGEVISFGGTLKVCSAANTWTTVGTQT